MTFQAKQRPGLFGQGAFMINPNATPEEIKRKRQALDSGSYGDAQFLGEGVADLFKGIVAGRQRKQMDDIERKGRDGANATMERITSMLNGTPYTPTSAPTPSPGNFSILGMKPQAEEESIAADTMAALGKGGGLTGDMRTYADSIASIESAGSGDYTAMGPVTRSGDRAYGRYQVMGNNIPVWTEKYLGKRMTPEEFVNDPAAQDAVFAGEFGSYVEKYGNPQDAASMWFSGRPLAGNNRNDGYTSVPDYVSRFSSGIGAPMGGSAPTQQAPQVDTAMLYEALANPWMSAPQKAMISSLIQQRQQANDPMYQLQMQKAQLELEQMRNPTPTAMKITELADGRKYYVDPTGKQSPRLVNPEIEPESGKDMTESERRIFMFNNIQEQTGPAVNRIEAEGFDPSNFKDRFAGGVIGGNWAKSTEGQMYDAAAGAWSESALRLATGAAATPEEYTRIRNMYFAAVGDSIETIQFKRAMREAYQNVLSATLEGDTSAELPNPLMFAIDQYYAGQGTPGEPDFSSMTDDELNAYITENGG